jgi:hypothetical protein
VIAEAHSLRVFFTAFRTNRERQRRTAIVAKFTRPGWLAAGGADNRFAFQLPFPDGSGLGRLVDVAAHSFRPRLSHRHLLSGRAIGAEHFILVVAGITHPLMTAVTAVKMPLCFILRPFKGFFMLLLPFGAHTLEPLGKNISAAFQRIAKVTQSSAKQAAQSARTARQSAQPSVLFISLGFHEAAFISVLTQITVESELESGFCGVVFIISRKGLQHGPSPHFFTGLIFFPQAVHFVFSKNCGAPQRGF